MIELHGWVTVRDTYKDVFWEDDYTIVAVALIQEEIDKLKYFKPEIRARNGSFFMEFSNYANRINGEVLEIFELYEKIGKIAVGSFGLIYLYDDENSQGKENQFQVFILSKGVVREAEDSFLSPVVPTVEDEVKR